MPIRRPIFIVTDCVVWFQLCLGTARELFLFLSREAAGFMPFLVFRRTASRWADISQVAISGFMLAASTLQGGAYAQQLLRVNALDRLTR